MGFEVAQWLEHPTRSRRVVGSNPIWSSDFFPSFHLMLKPYHVVISSKDSLGWLDGCISDISDISDISNPI